MFRRLKVFGFFAFFNSFLFLICCAHVVFDADDVVALVVTS